MSESKPPQESCLLPATREGLLHALEEDQDISSTGKTLLLQALRLTILLQLGGEG
jgi:hypothetical protein